MEYTESVQLEVLNPEEMRSVVGGCGLPLEAYSGALASHMSAIANLRFLNLSQMFYERCNEV